MKLKVFYEDNRGYVESEAQVKKVYIKKIDNKNNLIIVFVDDRKNIIPLAEIRLAYLIDIETMHEFFRYEK